MANNLPADPGGRFDSDYHRRVLGHLPIHTDDYGWTVTALFIRMYPDPGTRFDKPEDLRPILEDLKSQGHAQSVEVQGDEIWRQSQQGSETMALGIPNEPEPGATPTGPAIIGMPGVSSGATVIPTDNTQSTSTETTDATA